MTRLRLVGFAALLLSTSAAAGVVTFTPEVQVVDPAVSTITTFSVAVESLDIGGFNALDMLTGSDDLTLVRWILPYDLCFLCEGDPSPAGIYPSDLLGGGFSLTPRSDFPVDAGTLTVDAAGLPPGEYLVMVDSDRDGGISSAQIVGYGLSEPLFGTGTVRVVPEPGVLSLLGLAMLGLIHGQRHRPPPAGACKKTGDDE